eukprot:TRINITY_DN59413_c0_g2_i1.p2 TRINITY_DN59413_c0_g2~~TRINITY_DN59413_c0_g2_i1.p2  ORF type:complete len:148 (-),score=4.20 TRINITY_DN59413_c0_g2_i1:10-453(-)
MLLAGFPRRILRYWLDYCHENAQEVSRVTRVRGQVDEVRGIMIQNIEKVLHRGEKLDLLVDKTDHMKQQAKEFRQEGRRLYNRVWYRWCCTKTVFCCFSCFGYQLSGVSFNVFYGLQLFCPQLIPSYIAYSCDWQTKVIQDLRQQQC